MDSKKFQSADLIKLANTVDAASIIPSPNLKNNMLKSPVLNLSNISSPVSSASSISSPVINSPKMFVLKSISEFNNEISINKEPDIPILKPLSQLNNSLLARRMKQK